MKAIRVDFAPGDEVKIDNEIVGFVIEVSCSLGRKVYRVAWMHNGDSRSDYFDSFRLRAAK